MIRFVRTFESNLIALFSIFLSLRQLKLMFTTGAHFMGAGCTNYQQFQCQILRDYSPAGLFALLSLLFVLLGLFGSWKMLCGRRQGLRIMIAFYVIQMPILASVKGVYHFPTGLNIYLIHQMERWAIGINFAALILAFALFGLWQNARRP